MSGKTTLFSSTIGDVTFPITPTSIDGMAIGSSAPAAVSATTLSATGPATLAGGLSTAGTFTLNGATAVTVANTAVTANSQILITLKTVGGTVGPIPHLATITPGTGFTVVGTALDTSVYNYAIVG